MLNKLNTKKFEKKDKVKHLLVSGTEEIIRGLI